jgi:hypothetical protein
MPGLLRKACLDTHGCSPCIIIWLIHLRLSVQVPARIHAINSAMPLPEKDLALQPMVGCGGDRLRACFDCAAPCIMRVFRPLGQGFGGVGKCPGRAMEEPERCIMVNCAPCHGPGTLAVGITGAARRPSLIYGRDYRLRRGLPNAYIFLSYAFFAWPYGMSIFPAGMRMFACARPFSVRAIEELTKADRARCSRMAGRCGPYHIDEHETPGANQDWVGY